MPNPYLKSLPFCVLWSNTNVHRIIRQIFIVKVGQTCYQLFSFYSVYIFSSIVI